MNKSLFSVFLMFLPSISFALDGPDCDYDYAKYGSHGSGTASGSNALGKCAMRAIFEYLDKNDYQISIQKLSTVQSKHYMRFKSFYDDQDTDLSLEDVSYQFEGTATMPNLKSVIEFKGSAKVNFNPVFKIDANGRTSYDYTQCYVSDSWSTDSCDRYRTIDAHFKVKNEAEYDLWKLKTLNFESVKKAWSGMPVLMKDGKYIDFTNLKD